MGKPGKRNWKQRWKTTSLVLICPVLIFFLLHLLFPLRSNIPFAQIVTGADGTILHAFLSEDDKWRFALEKGEIGDDLKKVILFKEDKYFDYHPGINPLAIIRAACNNLLSGRKTSGASTITMQVARLLYPAERTYTNKCIEIFRSIQLELKYSKEELLELYLCLAPYGGNIEGIKAAGMLYFGRPLSGLSLAQITTLSVIPNRPVSLRIGKSNKEIIEVRNKWLKKMEADKLFSSEEISDAIREPFDEYRREAPKLAPHFSLRMHAWKPQEAIIRTTIDAVKQDKISTLAYNYSRRMKNLRINNAAILLMNNKTGNIEAYLGSPDFADAQNHGQVDGVRAYRSPGSTLKPLIYTLAFDNGTLTPKSIINDVPVDFNGYAPENYNGQYNGPVTTEAALSQSLNIPAVRVLNEIGIAALLEKLRQSGMDQFASGTKDVGLSLALGACGVSLENLVTLYSSLADSGYVRKPNYLVADTTKKKKLFSSPAAYMTSEILQKPVRPDLPNGISNSMRVPKIAWKTGTSYGRRDAWSIGFNTKYTVGVWVGNFSGQGVPEISGSEIATPLLFEVFNSLDYNSGQEWFPMPSQLDIRYVCSQSGKPAADFCESRVVDYFIPGLSSIQKCDHQKNIFVHPDESFFYCTGCLPSSGYKQIAVPNYSADLLAHYINAQIPYQKTPPHNPSCTRIFSDKGPEITSLNNGKEYLLEKSGDHQLMLACNTAQEVKSVFWYVNDRFFRQAMAGEKIFFTATEGPVKISCTDDSGKNSDITLSVKFF